MDYTCDVYDYTSQTVAVSFRRVHNNISLFNQWIVKYFIVNITNDNDYV